MNRKKYKKSMAGIRPSEYVVERITDIPCESKPKKSRSLIIKKAAAAVLSLALTVGAGFGINLIEDSNKPLGIMVSYADEYMSVKSGTKQTICKGLYYAPADDAEKIKEQYEKAQKDYNDILNEVGELDDGESALWQGIGRYDIYDKSGNAVAKLYTSGAGYFVADKESYKNVKSFTVENENENAYLDFEWKKTDEIAEKILSVTEENADIDKPYSYFIGHRFTLTGDELRSSQKTFGGKGYTVEWLSAAEVFESAANESIADVAAITDKIMFTFEYEDGTVESASVNISFDSYGHMQIS